jgi:hypothetical protein
MRSRLALVAAFTLLLSLAAGIRQERRTPILVERPYSVQMHVHGSFSEGIGSIDSHTAESERAGLDALWWSDHDWRIEGYRHCSRFSFDAFSERMDRNEAWTANTAAEAAAQKGVRFFRRGNLEAESAAIDAAQKFEGVASLRLEARSTRTTVQDLAYVLYVQRSRFLRPLGTGVTLALALFPELVGPDAHAFVELRLSLHPDPAVGPRLPYRIRYEFSPQGGPRTRAGDLYRVPVAVASGQWNALLLPLTDDVALGFPASDARDNVVHDVYLGVGTRNGATARANFDALAFSELVPPDQRYALQADMLLDERAVTPAVVQIQGTEISYIGEHLNEFSLGTELIDYEALFQASGLLNAQGTITNPVAMANYVARRAVELAHARGGLVSYNHAFGTNTTPGPSTPTKEQVLGKLLANDLYGADVLEVGYRQRGRPLADHLWVWDRLGLAGRFLVGTGVSDSHIGYPGEYSGKGNTFVSWIWAPSAEAPDLLAGLERGRVFFGDIAHFDGALDLTSAGASRMGDIVVTSAASAEITLRVDGLAGGESVRWILSGALAATSTAAAATHLETRVFALHPSEPTLVRVEVLGPGGVEKAFSNALSFVRAAPARSTARVVFE